MNSCVPQGIQWSIVIVLLNQLTNGSMAVNTNTLMQNAACVNSCIPQGMQLAVMVSLLSQIATGGGVGGGATIVTSNPQGSLTPTAKGQMVFNTTNSTLWINTDGTVNGWSQLI